jgi:MFS transporter, ACS family, hexuronate transporter
MADNLSAPAAELRRGSNWKWVVCGLLLCATMLNYMDRQTLALTITDISQELNLTNEQYGNIEYAFGMAFAAGGLITGMLVDRISVRWLYPLVLIGWSLAGIATAKAIAVGQLFVPLIGSWLEPGPEQNAAGFTGYVGLIVCRVVLGFFEAGQWPCALVVTQRILTQRERTFGNSLLQSGASVGAILTPLIVQILARPEPGGWQPPFIVIGAVGMLWVVPWLIVVRGPDVARRAAPRTDDHEQLPEHPWRIILQRMVVLIVIVVMINMTWQFYRAWLPKFLREYHQYSATFVNFFVPAYYIATDVGCLAIGFAVRQLSSRGWQVHTARVATFALCTGLTGLSIFTAVLPSGWLLLSMLLLIGFGALGLFPNYYSFTQELSARHQGKITGILGATTWVITSLMQRAVGQSIDATGSYANSMRMAGLYPLIGLVALLLLWPRTRDEDDKSISDRRQEP